MRRIETRQTPPVIEIYETDDDYPLYVNDRQTYITVHAPKRRRVRTSERYQTLFLRGMMLTTGAIVIVFLIAPQVMLASLFERIGYIFLALIVAGVTVGWLLGAWEFIADMFSGEWMR